MEGGDLISWAAIEGEKEKRGGEGGGGIVCSTENASVQDGSTAKVRKGSILEFYVQVYIFRINW